MFGRSLPLPALPTTAPWSGSPDSSLSFASHSILPSFQTVSPKSLPSFSFSLSILYRIMSTALSTAPSQMSRPRCPQQDGQPQSKSPRTQMLTSPPPGFVYSPSPPFLDPFISSVKSIPPSLFRHLCSSASIDSTSTACTRTRKESPCYLQVNSSNLQTSRVFTSAIPLQSTVHPPRGKALYLHLFHF